MTKAHLIEKVAEKATTLSRREVEKVVNCIFDAVIIPGSLVAQPQDQLADRFVAMDCV